MNIKMFLATVVAMMLASVCVFSQDDDRNPVIIASMNNLEYTHKKADKSAGAVIGEIATAVLTGQTSKQMEGYQGAVRSAILKGMSEAYRLRVVDGPLTKAEVETPGSIYVDATLNNISTTTKNEVKEYEEKNKDGEKVKKTRTEVYYRALLSVTLHVKDAMTDAVIASPSFKISESDMSWVNSPERAVENAINRLSNLVMRFFDGMYPLTCESIERGGIKNDKQKQVYIDLGSAQGLQEGQTFAIYVKKMIGGKEARQQVARLRVKKIEGEEVSFCKVLSGGEKVRCVLAKLMLEGANCLIFDEPTSHLDLEAIQSLNNGLIDFNGVVLFNSHDHQFVDSIANRIIEFTPKGLIDRYMKFDDYMSDPAIKALRMEMYGSKNAVAL